MLLLVLTFSSLCSCLAVPLSCHDGRIVGGHDIPIEEVPYQISLEVNDQHQCGGSIIAPNLIITAGHCIEGLAPEILAVRAGSSTRESGGQLVNVKKYDVHPLYNLFDYDFGIMELARNLTYSDKVKPIGLPSRSQSWPVGTEVLASGWGFLGDGATSLPENLQGVTLKLVDDTSCRRSYPGYITERTICAGVEEGGKGTCGHDSGGPLQADGILVGVSSFTSSLGCGAAGYPPVFANVAVFRDFIEEITQIKNT